LQGVAIVALISTAVDSQTRLGTGEDEAEIRQRRQAAMTAWNKHDSKAIAELFAPDVDRVRSNGTYYSGRMEVEKSYADTLSGVDKNATLKEERSSVRFLTPDVALLDIVGVITDKTSGTVLREHNTMVYVKRGGSWVTAAIRTTPVR
jgi:uncharacterized protein (TIGR02246 family)